MWIYLIITEPHTKKLKIYIMHVSSVTQYKKVWPLSAFFLDMFKRTKLGFPGGGSVVKNPPSNCREHRFYPCVQVQEDPTCCKTLCPWAATTEACVPKPVLRKRGNHCSEKPPHCNWRVASTRCDRQRLLSNKDPEQPLKKYKNKIYMPVHVLLLCWKMVYHVCLDGRPQSRC